MNNVRIACQHGEFNFLYMEKINHIKIISDFCSRNRILVYDKIGTNPPKRIASAEIYCMRLGLLWKYRESSSFTTSIYGVFGLTASYTAMMYSYDLSIIYWTSVLVSTFSLWWKVLISLIYMTYRGYKKRSNHLCYFIGAGIWSSGSRTLVRLSFNRYHILECTSNKLLHRLSIVVVR